MEQPEKKVGACRRRLAARIVATLQVAGNTGGVALDARFDFYSAAC